MKPNNKLNHTKPFQINNLLNSIKSNDQKYTNTSNPPFGNNDPNFDIFAELIKQEQFKMSQTTQTNNLNNLYDLNYLKNFKELNTQNCFKQIVSLPIEPPKEFMKINCGKLVFSPYPNYQNEFSLQLNSQQFQIGKNVIQTTKMPKKQKFEENFFEKTKETVTKQMSRKMKSDFHQRNTSIYLYFLLLAIDSKSEITINRNARDLEENPLQFKTYGCDSIVSQGESVYSKTSKYFISFDDEKKFNTVEFCEDSDVPKIDNHQIIPYTREQNNRIQQHILIQIINRLLKKQNMELKYYTKKVKNTVFLASIQFDEFFDINEKGEFVKCEKSKKKWGKNNLKINLPQITQNAENAEKIGMNEKNNENVNCFESLCDSILQIFSFFVDRNGGISKQITIGDLTVETNKFLITKDHCYIGRNKFFEWIRLLRTTQCSIDSLLSEEMKNANFEMNDMEMKEKIEKVETIENKRSETNEMKEVNQNEQIHENQHIEQNNKNNQMEESDDSETIDDPFFCL